MVYALILFLDFLSHFENVLPHRNMCGMHMPAGRLIRHRRTARCERNMKMRLRRRDVKIAEKCVGTTFILTGDDRAECFDGLYSF